MKNYVSNGTMSVLRVRVLRAVALTSFLVIMLLVGLSNRSNYGIYLEKRGFAVSGPDMAEKVSGRPIAQGVENCLVMHTITVRYFDYSGNELYSPVTMVLKSGQTFRIFTPHIYGYSSHTDIVEGIMGNQDVLYPIYYKNVYK